MPQNDEFHMNATCVGGFIKNRLIAHKSMKG